MKHLWQEIIALKSVPFSMINEMLKDFKLEKKFLPRIIQIFWMPIILILILFLVSMYMLMQLAIIASKTWTIIRESSSLSPEDKTIEGLWLLNDWNYYDSFFPQAVCEDIVNKWLNILYDGMVDIDLKERTNTVSKNRAEFSKEQCAHITWGEYPIDTVIRNLANELPYYE